MLFERNIFDRCDFREVEYNGCKKIGIHTKSFSGVKFSSHNLVLKSIINHDLLALSCAKITRVQNVSWLEDKRRVYLRHGKQGVGRGEGIFGTTKSSAFLTNTH